MALTVSLLIARKIKLSRFKKKKKWFEPLFLMSALILSILNVSFKYHLCNHSRKHLSLFPTKIMFCFHSLIPHLRKFQFSPIIFLVCNHVNRYGCHYLWHQLKTWNSVFLLETGLHSSSIREFLEKVMNSLTVTKRLALSKFTQMAVIKMCFFFPHR